MTKGKKKKTPRLATDLSTLDDFLKDQGELNEFQTTAIKEVFDWQITEAMKAPYPLRVGRADEDQP